MTVIDKRAPVLVTGGSGYIAGWIIRYLLEEGRTVHATVRDPAKKASVEHLHAIAAKTPGKQFPDYPFPRKELPKALVWLLGPATAGISRKFVARNVGYPLKFGNRKSREALGLSYRPIEATLTEHFQQLIDDGLLRRREAA